MALRFGCPGVALCALGYVLPVLRPWVVHTLVHARTLHNRLLTSPQQPLRVCATVRTGISSL